MTIEDMKIAMVDFSDEFDEQTALLGREDHPESDWALLRSTASFSHRDACEFILYIGDEGHIEEYRTIGFSYTLMGYINEAKNAGYKYLCLYA